MIKLKILVSVAVAIGALMAVAGPALAEFQSLPTKAQATSGKTLVLKGGEFVARNKANEVVAKVTCPTKGIKANWQIRSTGKALEDEKGPGQVETKRGPHLQYHIKWEEKAEECTSATGVGNLATTVEPCQLQLHQNAGQFTNVRGDVVTTCIFKVPGICEIKVPVLNETTGANYQLIGATLTNHGENQIEKVNVTGITQEVTNIFLCPLESNNKSELLNVELEQIGENAV